MSYLLKISYQNFYDEEKRFSDKKAAEKAFEDIQGESGALGASLYKVKHLKSWSVR